MRRPREAVSALENIEELINSVRAYTDEQKRIAAESGDDAQARVTLDEWLQNVALLTDMDNEKPEERNKVTMMTVHGAKGLEFEYVYVAGLEENLFPSMMSLGNEEGLEEERRLFYVALTRAKRGAVLSFAESRFKWGEMTFCRPSRFLGEIDPKFLDIQFDADDLSGARKEGHDVRCGPHTAAGAVTGNRKPGARIIRGTPGRIIPAGSSPAGNVRPNVLRQGGFRHAAAPVPGRCRRSCPTAVSAAWAAARRSNRSSGFRPLPVRRKVPARETSSRSECWCGTTNSERDA